MAFGKRREGTENVETARDRKWLVTEAGLRRFSLTSVLAGVLVAYGAFALIFGLVAGLAKATGYETDLSTIDWDRYGAGAGFITGLVLFLSYLFGGYVAGRMARRSGVAHGVAVFVLGVILAALAGALVGAASDTDAIRTNLRNLGVPTTADEWSSVATIAGLVALAAMLIGAILGGSLGERWHGKLVRRALDPDVGPAAEARRRADTESAAAEDRRAMATRQMEARRHREPAAERSDATEGHPDAGERAAAERAGDERAAGTRRDAAVQRPEENPPERPTAPPPGGRGGV
jgi:hypothetical protein